MKPWKPVDTLCQMFDLYLFGSLKPLEKAEASENEIKCLEGHCQETSWIVKVKPRPFLCVQLMNIFCCLFFTLTASSFFIIISLLSYNEFSTTFFCLPLWRTFGCIFSVKEYLVWIGCVCVELRFYSDLFEKGFWIYYQNSSWQMRERLLRQHTNGCIFCEDLFG